MKRQTKIVGAVGIVALAAVAVIAVSGDDDGSDGGRDSEDEAAETGEPGVLTAEDLAYDFDSIEVGPGDLITFRNDDTTEHTMTADDGLFDSGPVPPGESWVTSYDGPRTIDVHCDIHPRMRATIVVD